jgi:hypothetical protein
VKEKFTVNVNEAPDLSLALAFESHRAPQQSEKSNPNNASGSPCAVFGALRPIDVGSSIRQPSHRREQNESESQARAFKAGKGDEMIRFRHGRACPGHPRLSCLSAAKTWMPGTSPGMTIFA